MKRKKINKIKAYMIKKNLGDICAYCGCTHKFMLTLDHKKPLDRGGSDTDKNLHIACRICNQLKGNMTHQEFKKYIKMLNSLHDLNKISVNGVGYNFIFNPHNSVICKIMEEKRNI